jgi:hypothetical protein
MADRIAELAAECERHKALVEAAQRSASWMEAVIAMSHDDEEDGWDTLNRLRTALAALKEVGDG